MQFHLSKVLCRWNVCAYIYLLRMPCVCFEATQIHLHSKVLHCLHKNQPIFNGCRRFINNSWRSVMLGHLAVWFPFSSKFCWKFRSEHALRTKSALVIIYLYMQAARNWLQAAGNLLDWKMCIALEGLYMRYHNIVAWLARRSFSFVNFEYARWRILAMRVHQNSKSDS